MEDAFEVEAVSLELKDRFPRCSPQSACTTEANFMNSTPSSKTTSSGRSEVVDTPEAWIRLLKGGTMLSVDNEKVRVSLDPELWCLEIQEHELLYPLAELRAFAAMSPRCRSDVAVESEDVGGFALSVCIADYDSLTFHFQKESSRTSFTTALERHHEELDSNFDFKTSASGKHRHIDDPHHDEVEGIQPIVVLVGGLNPPETSTPASTLVVAH